MKIIWAFDPFQTQREQQLMAARLLKGIRQKKDQLSAVYVASNTEAELATAYHIPVSKRYSTYPKKKMTEALKRLNLKPVKAEVLFEKSLSLTAQVKTFTDYASQKKADLIVIATNNKKFVPRLVFGSFAESIVHLSRSDLFIFHQQTSIKKDKPQKILYANDLSTKGMLGLERAISYAKTWQAELVVVHIPIPEAGMSVDDFKASTQKKILKLERYMEKQKVHYQVYLEFDVKPKAETVLSLAQKVGADLIAVAAQAKKLEALLGGSITRQILRSSSLPTLVLKV